MPIVYGKGANKKDNHGKGSDVKPVAKKEGGKTPTRSSRAKPKTPS